MKVGLFFGSFNPIHTGHLIIASFLRQEAQLDEVWFMVSPQNPFKQKTALLNEYERLHLVNLAISNNQHLRASDFEFYLPRPSYTIDTLTHLSEKYPEIRFSLILGEDNLRSLHQWKNYELILKNYSLLVYCRERQENEMEIEINNKLISHSKVKIFHPPLINLSSTWIRTHIKSGMSMQYFLPEKVHEYITEMNWYK